MAIDTQVWDWRYWGMVGTVVNRTVLFSFFFLLESNYIDRANCCHAGVWCCQIFQFFSGEARNLCFFFFFYVKFPSFKCW